MASIQCSIELHDGVSPVLQDMALALDQFAGRMVRFGEDMGAIAPDVTGVSLFASALGELTAEAEGAFGVLGAVLEAGKQIAEVFAQDMFQPLVDSAAVATVQIEVLFGEMSGAINGVFQRIGRDTAALAVSLPRYFVGPLGEIAQMFATMAASARASMNSIAGSARAALAAVTAVNHAARTAPRTVSIQSGGDVVSIMAMPGAQALHLPEPAVFLGGAPEPAVLPTTVTVTVHNENHIASEVDAEAVLREMEVRLADAVASSMEGVYL